jgi:hypothetical protein
MEIKDITNKKELNEIYSLIVQSGRLADTFYTVNPDTFGVNSLYNYLKKKSYKTCLAVVNNKPHTLCWFTDKEGYYLRYHNCYLGGVESCSKERMEVFNLLVQEGLKVSNIYGIMVVIPDYFINTQMFMEKYSKVHQLVGHLPRGYIMPDGKDYGAKIYIYNPKGV